MDAELQRFRWYLLGSPSSSCTNLRHSADPNPLIASAPKTASNGAGRTAKALGTSIGQFNRISYPRLSQHCWRGFLLQLGMGARTTSRTGNSLGTQKEIENLTTQLEEFKLSMEGLEKERDFYFNKVSSFSCFPQYSSSNIVAHHRSHAQFVCI